MLLTRKSAYDRLCRILAPASPYAGQDLNPDHPCWPLLFEVADANFVLPELHQSIRKKGMRGAVPEPMLDGLDEVARLIETRNTRLLAQMREISAAFAEADILPVWLKGAALLTEPEVNHQPRLMSDLDVWVPEPEKQAIALAVLTRLGYATKPEALAADWDDSHHYAPLFHPERPVSLELHRHVVRKVYGSLLPDADAVERLDLVTLEGLPIARLALRDRIMHSLIQSSLMSTPPIETGQIRLMKMLDLARLLARDGTHALPPALLKTLIASPWRKPLRRFLTLFERDFLVVNPLGTDATYCRAVDHVLCHGRPSPKVVLHQLLRQPANWSHFLSHPEEWGKKLARRIRFV